MVSIVSAVPSSALSDAQDEARQLAGEHFRAHIPGIEKYLRVFKNACSGAILLRRVGWFRRSQVWKPRQALSRMG